MLWLRMGIRLVLLALIVLFLRYVAPPLLELLMPFVLALVVAWLLNPLVKRLQKRLGLPRGVLSILLLLLVFVAVGGVFFALGQSVFTEISSLVNDWEGIWASAQAAIAEVGDALDKFLAYLPEDVEVFVNQSLARLGLWAQGVLPELAKTVGTHAGSVAMSIPSFAVALIVFLMGAYFITADYPHLRFLVTGHLPEGLRSFFSHVKHTALGAFGGYVRAEVIISVGVFFILLVGFMIMGQGYAVLLALVLAVLDFIPIIGSGTVMVPWALVDLLVRDWRHALGLMIVWGIICVFRRVGEPKAVGSQTGLSPILSLVSMYVGMKLGGVLGMILGPVVCLVVINVCRTGIFDGLMADVNLVVGDTAALLRDHPPRRPKSGDSDET